MGEDESMRSDMEMTRLRGTERCRKRVTKK